MQNRKLSLLIGVLTYSGNSTGSSLAWPASMWLTDTYCRLRTEEKFTSRLHDVRLVGLSETPVTLVRNHFVQLARRGGFDLLVMLDSDMSPDIHVGEHTDAVPFIDAAFDRIYSKYDEGPRFVAAPYGGTPPIENCFEFIWRKHGNQEHSPFELDQFHREEVIYKSGIQEAAAAPTGLIMYDMRCFDLIEPPYFQYEYPDAEQTKKSSTEDVQNTRDISLAGCKQLGYNPCEIAWSSWAGHLKVQCVKKPLEYTADMVSKTLAKALTRPPVKERGLNVQVENLIGDKWVRMIEGNAPSPVLTATDSEAHAVY